MKLDAKKLDMSTFAPEPDDDIGDAFGGDAGWDLDAVADENWGMNEPAPEAEVRSVSPGRVASPPVKPASPAPLTASSSTKSPVTSPPITISKAGKGLSAVHGPGRAKPVNSTPSRRVSVSASKDKTNDGWGSFDDEQEEKEPEKVTSVASGVDKKAEMERMRLERKKRLEEAKKAKEAARNK
ncbi:hypothetical protein BT69DRAFT_1088632 [Atractiella rhizophila]|nr:hypothetical protein BT69DRAFT_1088632 [Atractiella rhizophila]